MFRWLNNFLHETVYTDTGEICKEEEEKTRKNSAYYNTGSKHNSDLYLCIFLLLFVMFVAIYLSGTDKKDDLSFGAITVPTTYNFVVRAQGEGKIKNLYVEDTQFVKKDDKIVDIEYEPRTGREVYLDEILYSKKAHHSQGDWKKHTISLKADSDGFIYNSKMHSGLPVTDLQELYEFIDVSTPICIEVVVTKDELENLTLGESVSVVLDYLENPQDHILKGTVRNVFDKSIRHGGNIHDKLKPLNDEPYKFVYVSLDMYRQKDKNLKKINKIKDKKETVTNSNNDMLADDKPLVVPGKLVTVKKEYPAKRRIVLLEEYFDKLWNDFLVALHKK